MNARVVLVRHCESAVDPSSPSRTWGLTARGHEQAAALVDRVGRPNAVFAGDEPKMRESLAPIAEAAGLSLHAEPALAETESEGWFGHEEFLDVVRRFFTVPSEPPAPGWETAEEAGTRVVERLVGIVAELPHGGRAVVCSGGRALTAALLRLDLLAPSELYRTWQSIRMPDVAELEWIDGHAVLRSPFGPGPD